MHHLEEEQGLQWVAERTAIAPKPQVSGSHRPPACLQFHIQSINQLLMLINVE
jgi:hypothetical protein